MKWIPSLVAAVVALLGVFTDPVQAYIAAHPGVAAAIAGIAAIIANLMKSPTQK